MCTCELRKPHAQIFRTWARFNCTKVWQSFIWCMLFHPPICQIKFSAQFSGILTTLVTNNCMVMKECMASSYFYVLTMKNEHLEWESRCFYITSPHTECSYLYGDTLLEMGCCGSSFWGAHTHTPYATLLGVLWLWHSWDCMQCISFFTLFPSFLLLCSMQKPYESV